MCAFFQGLTRELDVEIQRLERQIAQQRKITNQRTSERPAAGNKQGGKSSLRDKKELGHRIVLLENR